MPELPEVEDAARRLRAAVVGKTIVAVRVLHPSHRRRLTPRQRARLTGAEVTSVDRRGKHQLLHLSDGAVLHAHFRMTGDWDIGRVSDVTPRFARVIIDLDDGTRVSLTDSRALSTLVRHPSGALPFARLGPEATDVSLTAAMLGDALRTRRAAIKLVLLDQRVVAGLGNIYAAEALWHARIDPCMAANSLTRARLERLLAGIRQALAAGEIAPARYTSAARSADSTEWPRFNVYDREGEPCPRCGSTIRRIVQAGRSTYFCPRCQRS